MFNPLPVLTPRSLFPRTHQDQMVSTAHAFGSALLKIGGRHKNVVVLTANCGRFLHLNQFELAFPDRYFNFGNAEANMLAAAGGFAARGKIPFVCASAMFVCGRGWEQIRNAIALPYINVKIVSVHCGLSAGQIGAAVQALEDLALMRAIPNMKVVCPADAFEAKACLEALLNDFGPLYLRLNHQPALSLYNETSGFVFGKGHIYKSGTDVCIFAIGNMVQHALEAAEALEREKIGTMVVNLASLQPIDENLIVECAKQAKHVITVEDHQITGGLGSAVMEVLGSFYPVKVWRIGASGFGESGKTADLYKKYRLDGQGIYERVLEIIGY